MRMLLALAACITLLVQPASAETGSIKKGSVVVAPVEGAITEAQFFFLRRALKSAETAGASAFILDMDTPGGELKATEQIIQALLKASMPTITYVNTNAGSAGALIAIGTKQIYMAPVSAIGAAAPVLSTGADVPAAMNAKMVSYYSGYFRSVAEKNGYNPNLVDAFMNLDKEVKVGEVVLNPKGAVLTLSAQEATKVYDGKPLLASGVANNVEDLVEKAGLRGNIVRLEPSGFERVAQWITVLAPLFLLGGIVGAYIEMKTPGFGVAGFVSLVCFGIFFAGHYIAGLTGMEVVAVFILGFLLVLAELVLFPGAMILAAIGTALMFGALLFAMVDYFPGDPVIPDAKALVQPIINLGISAALGIVVIAILARFLPDIPIFRALFLGASVPSGPSISLATEAVFTKTVAEGDTGRAETILRPAGKAIFGAALIDVVTDGDFLEPGTRVRVLRVEGNRVVVGPV